MSIKVEEGKQMGTENYIILQNVESQQRYKWDLSRKLYLGRDPQRCSIAFERMNAVSGVHCRIFEHNGQCYLEDLHSRNGTGVNQKRISSPTKLHQGDIINITGQVRLQVLQLSIRKQLPSDPNRQYAAAQRGYQQQNANTKNSNTPQYPAASDPYRPQYPVASDPYRPQYPAAPDAHRSPYQSGSDPYRPQFSPAQASHRDEPSSSDWEVLEHACHKMNTSATLWMVLGILQVILGLVELCFGYGLIVIVIGVWNIINSNTERKNASTFRERPSGIVSHHESRSTTTIVMVFVNLFLGSIIGVFGSIYDMTVNSYVKNHKEELHRVEKYRGR